MRVLTWNLQWRERADWRSRQPATLSTLDSLGPDVAGVQELWVALAVVADHAAGPLHLLTSCIDREPRHGSRRPDRARILAALLTGDLNAPPSTPEFGVLTEVAVDAWAAANGPDDPGHTLSSANPLAPRAAWQLDHRIDYILARPGTAGGRVQVERCFLAGVPVDDVHPCDHWAVVADLRP